MIVPFGLIVALPCAGALIDVIVRASPSTSLSLSSTRMTTATSSSVVTESLTATGESFTGVTVSVTVTTAESAWPSFALYVKLSVPLKFATGVYVKLPSALSVSVP